MVSKVKRLRRERNSKGIFNEKDLTKYEGFSNPETYIGIRGTIFDVSDSSNHFFKFKKKKKKKLNGKTLTFNLFQRGFFKRWDL